MGIGDGVTSFKLSNLITPQLLTLPAILLNEAMARQKG
jgi:hypothetical protein